jgi:membrane protease YdiL (CAAX protease family)
MPVRDAAAVLVVGLLVLAASSALASAATASPAAWHVIVKAAMACFALALVAACRRTVGGSYGFVRAAGVPWRRAVGGGVLLGAASSLAVLLLGGRGMQAVLGPLSFWQIVLIIWVGSSVAEEMLTRGWAQGVLERWSHVRLGELSLPVMTGAVLFGSMHVGLFFRGVDAITASMIVIGTTGLGLWAGVLRERHRGLGPAIAAHVGFNAGGLVGGLIYVLAHRLVTGTLPSPS